MNKSSSKPSRHSQQHKKQSGGGNQLFVIGTIAVAVVILVVAVVVSNATKDNKRFEVSVKDQPVLGKSDAPVTLVEFGDFKCPSCKVFNERIMPQLKKDYIDTGKAKIAFVNDTIIAPDSVTAAMATESVFRQNPEAFWTYIEHIYTNQPPEGEAWATPERLVQMAKDAKLDIDFDKLLKEVKDDKYEEDVRDDNTIAQKVGATSTPTLLVNGKKIEQVFDYEVIKKAIDAEL